MQAQKSDHSTRSLVSGGRAHSDPTQFFVGCNVQWTPVSDPPSQPMCVRLLAGFLHSHCNDDLCTVLEEYVQAEVSFANLGVRKEARALVEQGGRLMRGGLKSLVAKVLQTALYPFQRGEGRFNASLCPGRVRRARASWKWGGGGACRPRP